MRVLITGGAGFLGSHLADALVARGDHVIVIDDFDPGYDPVEKLSHIGPALDTQRCDLVEGDCGDLDVLRSAFEYGVTRVAQALSRAIFEYGGKLPSILVPCRFEARFKPVRFSNRKLAERVDWTPPHDYAACLDRTFRAS